MKIIFFMHSYFLKLNLAMVHAYKVYKNRKHTFAALYKFEIRYTIARQLLI